MIILLKEAHFDSIIVSQIKLVVVKSKVFIYKESIIRKSDESFKVLGLTRLILEKVFYF